MSTATFESPKVHWDLKPLFNGLDDPKIEITWTEQTRRAEAFEKKYRGRINSPDLKAETLAAAIVEYESISQECSKAGNFASLLFATNAKDPAIGAFLQKQQERGTALSLILMFFELELLAADDGIISPLINDPKLAKYQHYILATRLFWGHVFRCPAKDSAVFCQGDRMGIRLEQGGNPKVEDFDVFAVGPQLLDENVFRLEVAMDNL